MLQIMPGSCGSKANARSLMMPTTDISQRAYAGEAVASLLESFLHQAQELEATSTFPLGGSRSSVPQLTSAAALLALPDTAA